MTYIKKFFKFLYKLWQISFGFLLICIFLYLRLHERTDYKLTFKFEISYLLVSLILLIVYFFFIIKTIFSSERQNFVLKKIKNVILYLYDCLDKFYQLIYPLIEKKILMYIPEILKKFIPSKLKNKKYIYFFVFLFPRLIISFTLFLDVVYFHKMHYFFRILIILWITIFSRIIIYIFNDWTSKFFDNFNTYFDVSIYVKQIDENKYQMHYFTIKKKHKDNKISQNEYETNIKLWIEVIALMDEIIYLSKTFFVKFIQLLIYFNFFFVWLYTVCKILEIY